jgi:hypothetical protein
MLFGTAQAQSAWSNQRSRVLEIRTGCYELDSLTVIPATVVLKNPATGERVSGLLYRISDNQICFSRSDTAALSLRIDFRVLPYRLGAALFRIDSSRLSPAEDRILSTAAYNPYEQSALGGLDFGGLQYNGSFARGLSFGNSQDLVLNSNFNLQMAGRLGDGLEIVAAITDENIPLQPEGNTRQLREFDRVFVQLSKGKGKLVAGDYDLLRPQSYFMNYFKRLQGLSFRLESKDAGKGIWRGDAALAISRGQFARNLITQQEGNQGPYRLRGNAGELFIIVLAGTEKVWLDGRLMERGIETDYIIDYNRGEITFTNRRLITKDSRIIVEFEYADQGYLRSLYAFNAEYVRPKSRIYANVFSQQDSRTSTGISPLSAEQRSILREAGDDFLSAVSSGIDSIAEFLPFRAQYRLADTLSVCGQRDTVLIFSTDPAEARYTARFSFVGQGRGNYVLDPGLVANERVYRWVAPDPLNCLPRGDYEPVVQLTAPQQQQLFTLGAEQRFSRQSVWRTELAMSRKDLNRFSDLDQQDDVGTALFSSLRHLLPLGKNATDTSGTRLELNADYEWIHRHFKALNPYRSPEFQRDWSLTDIQGIGDVQAATENLGRAQIALRRSGWGIVQYGFAAFLRDSIYRGARHTAQLDLLRKGWELKAEGSWLEAVNADQRNRFVRPRLRLSRSFDQLGGWRAGIYAERERNERRLLDADTLAANSFFYDLQKAYVESPAGKENFSLGAHFQRRQDYAPAGSEFVRNTRATELNLNGSRNIRRILQWAGNFTWRRSGNSRPCQNHPAARRNLSGPHRPRHHPLERRPAIEHDLRNRLRAGTALGVYLHPGAAGRGHARLARLAEQQRRHHTAQRNGTLAFFRSGRFCARSHREQRVHSRRLCEFAAKLADRAARGVVQCQRLEAVSEQICHAILAQNRSAHPLRSRRTNLESAAMEHPRLGLSGGQCSHAPRLVFQPRRSQMGLAGRHLGRVEQNRANHRI